MNSMRKSGHGVLQQEMCHALQVHHFIPVPGNWMQSTLMLSILCTTHVLGLQPMALPLAYVPYCAITWCGLTDL